jgi:hypothetical protein
MISRGIFAIKVVLLSFLFWQLDISDCAWAKLRSSSSSSDAANTASNSAENTEISQLEQKLFQRNYNDDLPAQRIERLEKMVFGKVGTGSDTERLAALKAATVTSAMESQPTTSREQSPTTTSNNTDTSRSSGGNHRRNTPDADNQTSDDGSTANGDSNSNISGDQTQYPAVTAIEKRIFGKDYSSNPITERLERLELKEFGKVSDSDDLSERMDKLKQATGIDIAKQHPAGSDWVDEDELSFTDAQGVGKITPFTPDAVEDGTDINNFVGSGSYLQGMRQGLGGSSFGGGSYGGGNGGYAPHTTPLTAEPRLGLNQEVVALEKEVFGKTYPKDALPARVTRLESAIFPDEKPAVDKSLPDRVSRLLAVVPLSDENSQQSETANATNQSKHGPRFSKLFGNMLGFTGSYPGSGTSNLSVDPQTGLLYNGTTGQLIDPATGAVIGQRAGGPAGGMSPWGFGSGMSPFGTMPYGYGSGMGIGAGRMGMGMGGFGLWP